MKLSDNAEVQKLITDHTRLRFLWSALGEINPNTRHLRFAAGYFPDSLKAIEVDPFPTDENRSKRIALGGAAAIRELVNQELRGIEGQLADLGVKADE